MMLHAVVPQRLKIIPAFSGEKGYSLYWRVRGTSGAA